MRWPWVSRKVCRRLCDGLFDIITIQNQFIHEDEVAITKLRKWNAEILEDNSRLRLRLYDLEGPKQHYENLIK